ncbi:MAG: TM2 domain-containing protein [Nitrosomonas sp.]|uniref:TM2 domain-containing protein n=1 Tax=Nitrosomonas sp. TaxID=42353 RepID=UPI0025CD7B29|nr:TM2 domain-containing protein [Nitrosomonas sp.]MBY0475893.1 TM2 domain-containing protein [Nitrosomonas sp.]
MRKKQAIQDEEERIRRLVRELPDNKRLQFFQQVEKDLKDPDTYATLNFLFIAGLHHFYLGKWFRGLVNFSIFLLGVILLFTPAVIIGVFLLLAITIIELMALFNAQIVVQEYNNGVMEKIYREFIADC